MDRRQFLRAGAAGAVALSVAPVATGTVRTAKTTIQARDGYIRAPAKKIPVVDFADVIVLGGGPAGFAAAVAAARNGSDTLLVERGYFLGGLFTGCGVTPIINMHTPADGGRRQAVFGVAEELCARLRSVGLIAPDHEPGNLNVRDRVDPEAAKYYMEEICTEAGVRILYGVHAAEVVSGGDIVKAVILEGKSGRVAVKCKAVVDCTGDGDVLEWLGEDFNVYKDNIGAMWRIYGVSTGPGLDITPTPGIYGRHTVGELDQDGLDMYNLTRVQLKIRKRIWDEALKRRDEGYVVIDTPSVVGVRVTRVLNSIGNVSALGAAEGKSYPDVIGFAGAESTLNVGGQKYAIGTRRMWQVPYSALVPKKTANLFVAGRCFGYEREITYDAREVGTCLMTGQAAGAAASLCSSLRVENRSLDVKRLQKLLRSQNVKLDW